MVNCTVHYVKKAGGIYKKAFKLKEITPPLVGRMELEIDQICVQPNYQKALPSTTIVIELIVNGETVAEDGFQLC